MNVEDIIEKIKNAKNECEVREACLSILNEMKLPCPCTVEDCPLRGICYLCIRNHVLSKTLPACCIPPIKERDDISSLDCRNPLLWVLDDNIVKEELEKITNEDLKRRIISKLNLK